MQNYYNKKLQTKIQSLFFHVKILYFITINPLTSSPPTCKWNKRSSSPSKHNKDSTSPVALHPQHLKQVSFTRDHIRAGFIIPTIFTLRDSQCLRQLLARPSRPVTFLASKACRHHNNAWGWNSCTWVSTLPVEKQLFSLSILIFGIIYIHIWSDFIKM